MNPSVSIFARCTDTTPARSLTMATILAGIRNPSPLVRTICEQLRSEPNKAKRRPIKERLPAICWGAETSTREAGATPIIVRSGIVCIDLDAVPDLPGARAQLQSDPHVAAVWLSPSGDGLKALIPVATTAEAHWPALAKYLQDSYGLEIDKSCKDLCRLCFVSYDPILWAAEDMDLVEPFSSIMEPEEPRRAGLKLGQSGPVFLNEGTQLEEFRTYDQARMPLGMISPNLPYGEWIAIGQAIHAQFGGSDEGLMLWDSWSSEGATYEGSANIQSHYKSFRSSGITFRSVLKKAIEAGWKKPRPVTPHYTKRVSPPPAASGFRENTMDIVNGKIKSIAWPWPLLSGLTQCLTPGSTTLLVGTPGSTKSWVILQSVISWNRENIKCGILQLEGDFNFWARRICAQLSRSGDFAKYDWLAANPEKTVETLDRHEKETLEVMQGVTLGNGMNIDQVVQWADAQGAAGVRIVIIDPLSLVEAPGRSAAEAALELMNKLTGLANKYKFSLILVTHNGALGTHRGPPGLDQVAGGKAFTRLAEAVIWLSAIPPEEDQTACIHIDHKPCMLQSDRRMKLLKVRSDKGLNLTICLQWDADAARLEQVGLLSFKKTELVDSSDHVKSRSSRTSSSPSDSEQVF